MKYIKITLLLVIAASSTLHGFIPGDAASAGTSNNTPALPPCAAIGSGFQYNSLTQAHAAQILTTLMAPQENQYTEEVLDSGSVIHGFKPGGAISAGALGIQEPRQSQESDAKKKHACPHCGHATNKKFNLTRHIRTHSDERPYKCDHPQCDWAFTLLQHLIMHKRTHTGEKPYKCKHSGCDKTFTQKSALNRHRKTIHGNNDNSPSESSMRLPSCEQTPADSQCHNFTQLTEELRGTALLLSLTSNPKRTSSGSDSASKRREVSADALTELQQYTSDSESE